MLLSFFSNFHFDAAALGIQLIGFAAMTLGISSFQAKERAKIILLQMSASVLWVVQFALLGGFTGAVLNLLAIVRAVLFIQKGKRKWASSIWLPIGMSVAFAVAGILTYADIWSVFPTVAMIISSFALFITNERKIRLLSLIVSPLWLVYDIASGSVAGVVAESLTIVSIIVALIRYRKKKAPEAN